MSASFEESCVNFRDFLAQNGHTHQLAWITSSDVLLIGPRLLYVKLPLPNSNREYARAVFETAMKTQSGVSLSAVGETDHATLCTVWSPTDESERQYAMHSKTNLKMSARTVESRVRAREVRNGYYWWYLQLRWRKNNKALKDQLFWG
jgi:hypothetical protein